MYENVVVVIFIIKVHLKGKTLHITCCQMLISLVILYDFIFVLVFHIEKNRRKAM